MGMGCGVVGSKSFHRRPGLKHVVLVIYLFVIIIIFFFFFLNIKCWYVCSPVE